MPYGRAGGALFAADAPLWARAITEVGAGLSAVLVDVRAVMVPLLARALDRERVPRRFLLRLPAMVVGVVLTGGPAAVRARPTDGPGNRPDCGVPRPGEDWPCRTFRTSLGFGRRGACSFARCT